MNFIPKSKIIFIFCISTFVSVSLSSKTCENDQNLLKEILKVERKYIDKGSFGEVWGNDEFVSKTIKAKKGIELQILNNELKVMIAFNKELDLMGLKRDSCYYEQMNNNGDYKVKVKMDKMETSLKNIMLKKPSLCNDYWKIDIMFQISIAIKKLHDKGVLHLDLKEQNIMLMDSYTPVIADFGFAMLPKQTRNFTCGTPLFMAPEIYKLNYTKFADIYALGIILFQLLNEKFVSSQGFRKSCMTNETQYTKLYCKIQLVIQKMLNSNYKDRITIDSVVLSIGKLVQVSSQEEQQGIIDYLTKVKQHYETSNLSQVVLKYKDQLIQNIDKRIELYKMFSKWEDQTQIIEKVQEYAELKKDPLPFFEKYNQQFDIIGHQVQLDQQDLESSLLDIKDKMEQSQNDRDKGIKIEETIEASAPIDYGVQADTPIDDKILQINEDANRKNQNEEILTNDIADEDVKVNKIHRMNVIVKKTDFLYKNPLDNKIINLGPINLNLNHVPNKRYSNIHRQNSIQPKIYIANKIQLANKNQQIPSHRRAIFYEDKKYTSPFQPQNLIPLQTTQNFSINQHPFDNNFGNKKVFI